MNLFPTHSEILVSPLRSKELSRRVSQVTKQVDYLDYPREKEGNHLFNGVMNDNGFRLSLKIDKADSFLPLIQGNIESTQKGCILFIHYMLFPSSRFFIGFWLIASFFLAFFFLAAKQDWLSASLCLVAGVGNYIFSWSNFKRKVKESRKTLHELLDLQIKGQS